MGGWRAMQHWPARRWYVAAGAAAAAVLLIGVPTVLAPNPVFGREIAVTWWSWPVLVATAVLSGLLTATYVGASPVRDDRPGRVGLLGGFLAYLAVGCPVCNKLALLALGYTGALTWFAPLQPVLALSACALLGYALHRRLTADVACARPLAGSL